MEKQLSAAEDNSSGKSSVRLTGNMETTDLKPKKKNVKHLQATHWVSAEIEETLQGGKIPTDAEIREFLNKHRSEN